MNALPVQAGLSPVGPRVPRILHQTWKTREVPEEWRSYRESWIRLHPEWQHRLWTDDELRQLVADRYPWFLPTFDAFPRQIQRVDAGKYLILYTHGGAYADLDCECLKPVDPLLEPGGAVVSRSADGVIDGCFLASSPGHPLWEITFEEMANPPWAARLLRGAPRLDASHVLLSTGPRMLKRVVRRYAGELAAESEKPGITILEPRFLSPRSWLRRSEPFRAPDAYLRHHYSDSWLWPEELALVKQLTFRRLALVAGLLLAAAVVAAVYAVAIDR